jgi:HAD superfamily hydrolase (TIGR01509 family)
MSIPNLIEMHRFDAILFDFDGVLIDSESIGNRHIAEWLTAAGHPTTAEDSMANFMGLAGPQFIDAVERWIDRPLPEEFYAARKAEDERVMAAGIDAIEGAVAFVRSLPADLPKAIVSSSPVSWIARHLEHIGLRDAFGGHLYSGREHVTHGKPAPDLYLFGARQLGVDIARTVILEDSPVGATGAVASGGYVIGLSAGSHCNAEHGARLRAIGVDALAESFEDVARLLKGN